MIDALEHALRRAHEALCWLGHVCVWMDTHKVLPRTELLLLFEIWSVAECCAEMHASEGYGSEITVDNVRELAGWDGEAADVLVRRALGRLVELGFVDGERARLVIPGGGSLVGSRTRRAAYGGHLNG